MKDQLIRIVRGIFIVSFAFSVSSYTVLPLKKISEKGVQLSHLPGTYSNAIDITISGPSNLSFYYSLNGSYPSKSSAYWNRPLRLDTVKSLVVALVRNNQPTDTFYAGTYVVGFTSVLPVTSLILPNEDLFNEQIGIYVGGRRPDGSLWGNCWKRNMEKAVFFEHFDNGNPVLSQQCGLKIFGGMTRENAEKSMRVIAKGKYGKGKFKYKMFSTKEVSSFNSLVLRTSGNDLNRTRFLDMMVSSIAKDLGIDYLAYKPSVLFVNGEYWGIHNIREKNGIDYLQENHGAGEEDTDLIREFESLEHGSLQKFKKLIADASSLDPSSPSFIDSLSRQMDIDNYLRYAILQIHIVNPDSRGNIRFWRSASVDDKFRWICYDADLSFSSEGLNFLEKKISAVQTDWYNPQWSTVLLRRLLANKDIRHQFITDYSFYLSTIFKKDSLHARIQYFKNWISPEIDRHVKRRNFNQTRANWETNVNRLLNFATKREQAALEHLKLNFNLGDMYNLSVLNEDSSAHVFINKNKIPSFPFQVRFFKNISFNITATPSSPRFKFLQWADGNKNATRLIQANQSGDLMLKPVFEKVNNSEFNKTIRIKAFGKGMNASNGFVIVESDKKMANEISLVGATNDTIFKFSVEKGINVICADSNAFRADFPQHTYHIIESPLFNVSDLYAHDVYVLDHTGNIIEFIEVNPSLSAAPYVIKSGDHFEGLVIKPDLTKAMARTGFALTQPVVIGLSILAMISVLVFIIMYRKKKSPTVTIALVLISGFTYAQMPAGGFKKIDPAILIQTGIVDTSRSITSECYEFICNYQKSEKPLSWVGPIAEISSIDLTLLKSFTLSYYKEVSSVSILHPRLKSSSRDVRLLIPGIRYQSFLVDSVKGEYLLEVEHSNTLRSWYYPILPHANLNIDKVNNSIGYATEGYYVQLRYKNKSIDLTSIIKENGIPDAKGIFIENYSVKEISALSRVVEFKKNFRKDIWNVALQHDFSADLEREMNKK